MKKPPILQQGDTIALTALASQTPLELLQPAISVLENWGLKVVIGASVSQAFPDFISTSKIRLNDFQNFLDDAHVKAIFSIRGGYGSYHLLEEINWNKFRKSPKWLVGYSDITAVHAHTHRLGFESIHGAMPKSFLQIGGEESLESLRKILFGEENNYEIQTHPLNRNGTGQGQIIGGNLALICSLMGTKSEINTNEKILFIEDIDEHLYRIDRMMSQLKRAGKLKNLAGLIVGDFSNATDGAIPFGTTFQEIILNVVSEYDYPVAFNFPVGHEANNWAIPCGRVVQLTVEQLSKLSYVKLGF
jgi:muramoyltetrapeptide carboxypeptidase